MFFSRKKVAFACLVVIILWFTTNWQWWALSLAFCLVYKFTALSKPRKKIPSKVGGHVEPGFEAVAEAFRKNLSSGLENGAAFSVYHRGRLVVDIWGGLADYNAQEEWKEDTISVFFSTTKGVTAVVIAHLVEKGYLNYETPVCEYWPEFSQEGKDKITLKELLSHQAGLCNVDKYRLNTLLENPEEFSGFLARQKPRWKLGTGSGYHALTFGLYMDQIVQRVDPKHRNIATYFKEEIAEPFKLDFYIGLPDSEYYRCASSNSFQFGAVYYYFTLVPMFIHFIFLITIAYFKGNTLLIGGFGNPSDWKSINNKEFRKLPIASSHGFGSARAVAKLYGILANGGKHHVHGQLLNSDSIAKLQTPVVEDVQDKYLLVYQTWGYGMSLKKFGLDGKSSPERYIFGHPGAGGQAGYADPHHKLGWGYLTNSHNWFAGLVIDHRYQALIDAMYECMRKIEKNK